jgi:hypothetical protein
MQKLILQTVFLLFASASLANSKLTDETFNQLAREHREGIIYLWSPLMPLSVVGRTEIGEVAKELTVALTTVVDPFAAPVSTTDPIMASPTLMSFGMLDHYPAVAIYQNGHLVRSLLVLGYEAPKTLTQLLSSYFERECE